MNLNLTREQVETIRSLRREEYDDDMLTADWLTLHAEVEKQAKENDELRSIIKDFLSLYDSDIIEPTHNGVGAFGIDDGAVRCGELIRLIINRARKVIGCYPVDLKEEQK